MTLPSATSTPPVGRSGAPVLAVDIGGTKIAAALVSPEGVVSGLDRVSTPAQAGRDAVLEAAVTLARRVVEQADVLPPAVGIGSAGVIDPRHGVVTSATDAIRGWAGADVAGAFAGAFGAPTAVLNDVHAHALGEARYGAGVGVASMLLVAVGTGVGGGFVLDGRVVVGAHHLAGHVGHVVVPAASGVTCTCGRAGHLEGFASGPGTLAAYRRAGGEAESTVEVARRAVAGEDLAGTVLATAGRAVGEVIGGLLNVLDPDLVVLTGGMADAGECWRNGVDEGIGSQAMDAVATTPIVGATAGVEAALLGAAWQAQERYGNQTRTTS